MNEQSDDRRNLLSEELTTLAGRLAVQPPTAEELLALNNLSEDELRAVAAEAMRNVEAGKLDAGPSANATQGDTIGATTIRFIPPIVSDGDADKSFD
jgi:hypothetical protein